MQPKFTDYFIYLFIFKGKSHSHSKRLPENLVQALYMHCMFCNVVMFSSKQKGDGRKSIRWAGPGGTPVALKSELQSCSGVTAAYDCLAWHAARAELQNNVSLQRMWCFYFIFILF